MKRIPLIYCFHCILTGKKYIGKSISISKRLNRHQKNVRDGVVSKFYNAVRKYGWENFIFGIIEECDESVLNEREIFYIETYKTLTEGYNMTSGGDGGATYEITDEIRKRLSKSSKGRKHTDEAKSKISKANRGRKWSNDAKQRLSEKLKGRKPSVMSDEARKRMSEQRRGISRDRSIVDKMMETRKINQSFVGKNNPNSKVFVFTSPQDQEHIVIGQFKKFCKEQNISCWGMKNMIKTGKMVPGCKNWKVRAND